MNEIIIRFQDGCVHDDTLEGIARFCTYMDTWCLLEKEYVHDDLQLRVQTTMDVDAFWFCFKKAFDSNLDLKYNAAVVHMLDMVDDFTMLYHCEEPTLWRAESMH